MTNFQKGDVVWAKMRGFPYWPGIITDPLKGMKKSAKNNVHCIYFFGSKNYSLIEANFLKPYIPHKEEFTKASRAGLKAAVEDVEKFLKQGDTSLNLTAEDPFDKLIEGASSTPKGVKKSKTTENENKSVKRKKSNADDEIGSSPVKAPRRERKSGREGSIPKKQNSSETVLNSSAAETDTSSNLFSPSKDFSFVRLSSSLRKNDFGSHWDPINLQQIPDELKKKNITPSDAKFGFIGMGVMGSRILKNLVQSYHDVWIWNRSEGKCEPFEKIGVKVASSPYDVVNYADITFLCVANDDAALRILFGSNLLDAIKLGGKCFVNMTSVSSETSEVISDVMEAYKCQYLEVRLMGTPDEADMGMLYSMAAGDKSLFDSCESCFKAFSIKHMFMGTDCQKVCRMYGLLNSFTNIMMSTLAESISLHKKAGQSTTQLLGLLAVSPFFTSLFTKKCKTFHEKRGILPTISPQVSSWILSPINKELISRNGDVPIILSAYDFQRQSK